MLMHMRTTIQLDDEVFRAYKARAVEHGSTFAAEVEQALRADLARRADRAAVAPMRLRTVNGRRVPGVDPNSNAALGDLLGDR